MLYISVARVIFNPSSTTLCYDVQVLLTSVQKGTVQNVGEALLVCCMISSEGDHKFCLGLNVSEYYDKYHSVICFHLKSVRLWDRPFKRIDSEKKLHYGISLKVMQLLWRRVVMKHSADHAID